ncbi:hypothetical protein KBA41_04905 [Candidatus Ozemobacteraceae bacterium]|nr:hypothetical protein [Candidatus Ozemobacteraceae bacterium]
MTQSSVESTSSTPFPAAEAPATRPGEARGYDEVWAGGWICLLVTVYLCGAFLNSLMRWLAYGALWDLTGLVLSGVIAWASYYWTTSESAIQPFGKRVAAAICLLVAWILVFPALMWSCGFQ